MNKLINKRNFDGVLKEAINVLRSGGVIAHATDTCYGFACDTLNKNALKKLYVLKKMPLNKPVSVLVADFTMAKKYGRFNATAQRLAQRYWPGALTIIVPREKTLPAFLNPHSLTIGIRVPAHEFSRKLTRVLGRPITTTSANISKLPSPYSASAIHAQFKGESLKPDLIVNEGLLNRANLPSAVVEVKGREVKMIRRGRLLNLKFQASNLMRERETGNGKRAC